MKPFSGENEKLKLSQEHSFLQHHDPTFHCEAFKDLLLQGYADFLKFKSTYHSSFWTPDQSSLGTETTSQKSNLLVVMDKVTR